MKTLKTGFALGLLLLAGVGLTGCADVLALIDPAAPPSQTPPQTFTVTFESNGGTSVPALTGLASGSLIAAPTAPAKAGYAFAGWFSDAELTASWRFNQNTVVSNLVLYARWGSDDAVGAWFDLQDAGAGDSDDTEVIWVFQVNGRYQKFSRPHTAGDPWTSPGAGPTVSRDVFHRIEEGTYFLDSASLQRQPRKINVIALGLVSGAVSDTDGFGLLFETEATNLLKGTTWENDVSDWFHPAPSSASFSTVRLAAWDDEVARLDLGSDVLAQSPLATVITESGDDFRSPNALQDYPEDVQAVFPPAPTNPLGVTAVEVEAAWSAYQASAFFQGLTAAGAALVADATQAFAGGASSIDRSGTTGSVAWTNQESVSSTAPGLYSYSGTATYRPLSNEDLPGGLSLLATTLGTSSYTGDQDGLTSNLGTWTLEFSGGEVETLTYQWDDLSQSFVGDWTINGSLTFDPDSLP